MKNLELRYFWICFISEDSIFQNLLLNFQFFLICLSSKQIFPQLSFTILTKYWNLKINYLFRKTRKILSSLMIYLFDLIFFNLILNLQSVFPAPLSSISMISTDDECELITMSTVSQERHFLCKKRSNWPIASYLSNKWLIAVASSLLRILI